jgi:hypothetical protein
LTSYGGPVKILAELNQPREVLAVAAVELFPGRYLSFTDAAKLFPPGRMGRPVAAATLWRWSREGVRLPDGSKVKLRVVRIGGRFAVSEEALREFIDQQQPTDHDAEVPAVRSASARRRASDRAGEELTRLGI